MYYYIIKGLLHEYCPSQYVILHSQARAMWYTARDNIHQYSCNNPIILRIICYNEMQSVL